MLCRAFFGAPGRLSPRGIEVGALVTMTARVARIMARARAKHFAFVFDPGDRTFRHTLDARYKAKRPETPAPLKTQFELAKTAVRMMGFPVFCVPGFEADDLMATLSRRARAEGLGVWLVSPDKDLGQLLTEDAPCVRMFDPGRRRVIDVDAFREAHGVSPKQAVDYFALTGDSSDNVCGVPGVGPKAAQVLIETFGSLEGIYQNLETIPSLSVRGARSLAAKIEAGRDEAFLARDLVRLRSDVPVEISGRIKALTQWREPHPEAACFFRDIGTLGPLRRLETRGVNGAITSP